MKTLDAQRLERFLELQEQADRREPFVFRGVRYIPDPEIEKRLGMVAGDDQLGDAVAASMLTRSRDIHSRDLGWGCSLVSHRDLGFCARCTDDDTELTGWRLLAMAQRGLVEQPVKQ